MLKWLLVALVVTASPLLHAIPQHSPVPGGVAVIDLKDTASVRPDVRYEGQRVMLLHTERGWQAIVGIPLAARTGTHYLRYSGDAKRKVAFKVRGKKYAEQRLNIDNQRMVNPTAEDLVRIGREAEVIRNAFLAWTETAQVPPPLLQPTEGIRSSSFGLRRYFNGEARNPHSGMDIAAPVGQPVITPADGTVVAIGDYFFNGRTVFIDHGQGLVSMFCHLDSVAVEEGQSVGRGQPVAKVGMSGRVTGPHLHWSISLNNARVDPALFMPASP